jgi:hypothetical protein
MPRVACCRAAVSLLCGVSSRVCGEVSECCGVANKTAPPRRPATARDSFSSSVVKDRAVNARFRLWSLAFAFLRRSSERRKNAEGAVHFCAAPSGIFRYRDAYITSRSWTPRARNCARRCDRRIAGTYRSISVDISLLKALRPQFTTDSQACTTALFLRIGAGNTSTVTQQRCFTALTTDRAIYALKSRP